MAESLSLEMSDVELVTEMSAQFCRVMNIQIVRRAVLFSIPTQGARAQKKLPNSQTRAVNKPLSFSDCKQLLLWPLLCKKASTTVYIP